MSTFDDVEPATLGPDLPGAILKDKIPNSSPDQTNAVARALISRDQTAYTDAMTMLIRQTSSTALTNVENIHVVGDSATAEATITTLAGGPPQPDVRTIRLVRENNRWKDCTPPSPG